MHTYEKEIEDYIVKNPSCLQGSVLAPQVVILGRQIPVRHGIIDSLGIIGLMS